MAIAVERRTARIEALLAILKAGGAYLPLDPADPPQRLEGLAVETGARWLVADRAALVRLPGRLALERICPEDERPALATLPSDPPADRALADGLAYVLFTSGSTGRPRAVAVPHRAVVRLVTDNPYADFGPHHTFLHLAPLAFDASTFEIWGALLNGARLALAPPGRRSLDDLGRLLASEGVTTLWLTAGLFHQMVDEQVERLGGLRQLLAGGDVLSPAHVRRLIERWPDLCLVNGYGPTENTTFTCCHAVDPEAAAAEGPVPIGRPIAHGRVHVLGPGLAQLAAGEPGELCAAGAGLARGYLGRPAATAERFVPDPFGAGHGEPGARLYRTGDLARAGAGGAFEFLGRIDRQVKVRGFRVEPGEVEAALAGCPRVRQAVVDAVPDAAGGRRLAAWIVPSPGAPPSASDLRRSLAERLPEHLVPTVFVTLAELPLNANGKVDRRALPPPPPARPELSTPYREPRGPREEVLAAILAELLGLDRVGADDDLFELGGHSLVATRWLARAREQLGAEVPMADLFAAPTVAALAARAGELGGRTPAAPELGRARPSASGSFPVSSAQRRIWFLLRLDPTSLAYNFQASLRLRGRLDVGALARALAEIVRRHEIFRTTYPAPAGDPVAVVHPFRPPPLPVVDLRALPDPAAEAARRLPRLYRRPYRLDRLPLAFWALFALGPEEHLLLHAEHHILHDGWSFNVFLGELAELYRAFAAGGLSPLPEPERQFVDFADWQLRWVESEEAAAQLGWWRRRLADPPAELALPRDHPLPPVQSFRGGQLRVRLAPELAASLRAIGRRAGATLFMTLLTAFFALLRRVTGQDDLTVGCGVANRRRRELEGLIGMVINTVVMRAGAEGDPPFTELLGRVRRTAQDAYARQELPLEKVVAAVAPDRSSGRNPLFQVAFSAHDAPLAARELPGLALETTVGLPNGSAKFDLNVIAVMPHEQRLATGGGGDEPVALIWEYASDLFDLTTVRRLLGHYLLLLEAAAAAPGERLSRLPVWTPAQRHQVLVEWAGEPSAAVREATLDEVFAAQARRHPDAVALAWDGGALSYGELARRAEGLAATLRSEGVGACDRVAVALERGPELIVTLLAVLRAGAAYAPLDLEHPAERLVWTARDLGAAAIVARPERLPAGLAGTAPAIDPRRPAAGPPPSAGPASASSPGAGAPAYVMYTSGSTGRPKGVVVPHRAVVRRVLDGRFARWGAGEVWLQLAPAGFDASTLEIWGALLHGGRLVLAPPGAPGIAELSELLARQGVTSLWLTAGLFHLMAEHAPEGLGGLRQLLAGGDVLSPERVADLAERLPGLTLINGYGPTENTTFTACHTVTRPARRDRPVPIGRPVAGTRVTVVGDQGEPVPPGVVGELWTGGDGLALGYLGRPALTAERFVPDPWGETGARAYRTGDLVRWLPGGELEFVGRRDGQVKVRGFRVEVGEVEAHLARHPAVARCAVVATGDGADRSLVGCWVRRAGERAEPAALREHLALRLPGFMVPAALVERPELPLNANGKVDRRALAREAAAALRDGDGGEGEGAFVPPGTEAESLLAELWTELLGRTRVGAHDNFFDLGGNSLHATRHMHRLREMLDVELPVRALYEARTLAQLARRVEDELLREPAA